MAKKEKLPWIPFYPTAWLSGTLGFTAEQKGVYITLLMIIYDAGKPIIRDDETLAKACGINAKRFRIVLESLVSKRKIIEAGATLTNPKAEVVLQHRKRISSAAKKSVAVREKKKAEQKQGEAGSNDHRSIIERSSININITEDKKEPSSRAPKKRAPTMLPQGWRPMDRTIEILMGKGHSSAAIEEMIEAMTDWAQGTGRRKLDWDATFRTWARQEHWRKRSNGNGTSRKTNTDNIREAFDLIDRLEQSRSGEADRREDRELFPGQGKRLA